MNDAFVACFGSIEDPRVERTKVYALIDIFVIAVCAILGGAQGYEEINWFGTLHESWFKKHLPLLSGIPSDDTFRRVFDAIDNRAFQKASIEWLKGLSGFFELKHPGNVAIDGKTLRGSKSAVNNHPALHILGAFSADNRVALGAVAVNEKTNELTAIPHILAMFDLQGATVTMDAMACHKTVAADLIAREADYVIALKQNQKNLFEAVVQKFALCDQGIDSDRIYVKHDTPDLAHGRTDLRKLEAIAARNVIDFIDLEWPGLKGFIRITHKHIVQGKEKTTYRYYITSLLPSQPSQLLEAVRSHWGIENDKHWSLDVSLGEDRSRIRHKNGALNFAWARRLALGILKNHDFGVKRRLSIRQRQLFVHAKPAILIPAIFKGN